MEIKIRKLSGRLVFPVGAFGVFRRDASRTFPSVRRQYIGKGGRGGGKQRRGRCIVSGNGKIRKTSGGGNSRNIVQGRRDWEGRGNAYTCFLGGKITLQDDNLTKNDSSEQDQAGGSRKDSEYQLKEESILVKQGGEESPYVVQVHSPEIEGVVVVAQGIDSSKKGSRNY